MKLTGALHFTMGTLAAASALPRKQADSSVNQLQPSDPAINFVKLNSAGERSCRARIMEAFNPSAIYSIVNTNENVCSLWVSEVSKNCPDVQTLNPSEIFLNTNRPPDERLASIQDENGRGWVSSEGTTNKTIADCTAAQFTQVIDDLASSQLRSSLSLGLGIGLGSVGLMSVMAGVAYCLGSKKSARVTPGIEMYPR